VLPSADNDPREAARRRAERRVTLLDEIARCEDKLANKQFVAKAPPQVVETEREKLRRYRAELEELEGGSSSEAA
jgi:valyl-tRNA synthetase